MFHKILFASRTDPGSMIGPQQSVCENVSSFLCATYWQLAILKSVRRERQIVGAGRGHQTTVGARHHEFEELRASW